MKNKFVVLYLLLLSIPFFSCDKDENNDDCFIYPLSVGNIWEYSREFSLFFYPDSLESPEYYDTLTYTSNASVVISGIETLPNSLETYILVAEEYYGTHTCSSIFYYNNLDDGLYCHAYSVAGGPVILPKTQTNKILFKGMHFNCFRDLSDYFQNLLPSYRVLSDTIIFEDSPVKALQYPLKAGVQWTCRKKGNPFRLDKKVISNEEIEVPAGIFSCFKIQFLYDVDEDDQWDEDISIIDYIGEVGLVKRTAIVTGMRESTVQHPEGTGNLFDAVDEFKLTDVSLE